MATYEDLDLATNRAERALEQGDLDDAKAALAELVELKRVFTDMAARAKSEEQRETAQQWADSTDNNLQDVQMRVEQLETEMLDPEFQQRRARRDAEKKQREAEERAKAKQVLQNMGGFGQALAGLAGLGDVFSGKAPAPAAAGEKACPACNATNKATAKFCGDCGKPLARACAACGADLGSAKFCPECGAKA